MHISNFWNIVPVWSSKSSCPQHVFDCLQLLRLRLPCIYPTSKDKFDIGVQHYMLRYENDSRLPKNISRWTVDCSISFGVWHTVPYITTVKEKSLTNNSCYWITWKKKILGCMIRYKTGSSHSVCQNLCANKIWRYQYTKFNFLWWHSFAHVFAIGNFAGRLN